MHKYSIYLYFINVLINVTKVVVLTGGQRLELCHVTTKSCGKRSACVGGTTKHSNDLLQHSKEGYKELSDLIEFDREKSGISVIGLDFPGRTKDSDSKELSLSYDNGERKGEK